MKNLEILQSRIADVERFMQIAGKLVSWEWIRRNLLMQTDDEMKQLDSQMLKEKSDPRYQALEAMSSGGMGMGMPGGKTGQHRVRQSRAEIIIGWLLKSHLPPDILAMATERI